jgi:O-antigen/teichoic acid export membrane protein
VKGLSGYVRLRPAPGASLVAFKTSADVVSKAVTLIVTVAAARALPATDFGVMALAMTTGWLLGVASDAGLPLYLATRVAQNQLHGRSQTATVRSIMRWRAGLAAVALAVGLAFGAVLAPTYALLSFVLIVAHQLLGAVLETLAHSYRGLGRTDVESAISLAHRGAIALGALTVLAVHPSLLALAIVLAVPPLLALLASLFVVRRLAGGDATESPHAPWLTARRFLSDVAPLGLGVLLSALYFRCDVYFLGYLRGVETVGLYNATFRIVDALRLFPAAALAVAYPTLCAATDTGSVRRLAAGLAAAALVVGAALYIAAHPLLALVYGDAYAAGGDTLRVLAFCVPFFYVNYALTHQVIAWEGQRAYLAITAAALVANLTGNTLLIPGGGMIGAATSTLATEVVVCGGCLVALARR